MKPRLFPRRTRGGFPGLTLLEVVVTIAVLGVIAVLIVLSAETGSLGGGKARRIDDAAFVLLKLRNAAVRYNFGDRADTSFTFLISGTALFNGGVNPGRLSQLTNMITTADRNSCATFFTTAQAAAWHRNFYLAPIPATVPRSDFRIADGFIANDSLERFNNAGAPTLIAGTDNTTTGTLAIVMQNVELSDARALADRMEGDKTGGNLSVVRFTTNGTAPVTVYYHMGIHGC